MENMGKKFVSLSCFLDDTFYPKMSNKNIYYINIKPYVYDLPFDLMIDRFFYNKNNYINLINNKVECKEFLLSFMNNYQYLNINKKKEDYLFDIEISNKILLHLKIFFSKTLTNETRNRLNKKTKLKTKKNNNKK